MPRRNEIYKCEICGNVVEVTNGVPVPLFCCGTKMAHQVEQTADSATEKHVPILEPIEGGTRVKVGSVDHPMTENHYIQWIEIINGSYIQRKYLEPGDSPYADFYVPYSENLQARSFCNLHNLWTNK